MPLVSKIAFFLLFNFIYLSAQGIPYNQEFKVQSKTGIQNFPNICTLKNGNYVITWETYLIGNFAQIYDNNFNAIGSEFKLVSEYGYNSDICKLSDGGFAFTWNSDSGIYFQILLTPQYDSTHKSKNIIFSWTMPSSIPMRTPKELEYTIFISENPNFFEAKVMDSIYDTTCVVEQLKPGTTYYWKVLAKNIAGDSLWSSETNAFFVDWDVSSLEDNSEAKPKQFQLYQNYPNPFNPSTTIKYNLPAVEASYDIKIKIYNSLGQLIITLVDSQQKPGEYKVLWHGVNAQGVQVPSGVYFCVLEAGTFRATQKMILLR